VYKQTFKKEYLCIFHVKGHFCENLFPFSLLRPLDVNTAQLIFYNRFYGMLMWLTKQQIAPDKAKITLIAIENIFFDSYTTKQ